MAAKTRKPQTLEPPILGALRGEMYRYERPNKDARTLRELLAQFKAEGVDMGERRLRRLLGELRQRGILREADAVWPDKRGHRNHVRFYWIEQGKER